MTRLQRGVAFLMLALMIGAIPLFGADFYEAQLRNGVEAFRAGRTLEAIDYFRIANFGFLDHTLLLSEGLARLAVAESAAGRKEQLGRTLERFVSLERQFPSYAKANLDAQTKAAFEKILLVSITSETLASVPSLASLAPSVERDTAEMTPEQRRKYFESKASKEPRNPEWPLALAVGARERGDDKTAIKWADRALKADKNNIAARVLKLAIYTERQNDSRALTEIRALPEAAWLERPSVVADAFVVFVRSGKLDQAGVLVARIPESEQGRSDVAAALETYRARTTHPPANPAPAEPEVSAAAPPSQPMTLPSTPVEAPKSVPVKGSVDVADTRAPVTQGSFTASADPIAKALTNAKKTLEAGDPSEAQRTIRDALRKTPGSRDLRLAMLEASCLARDWPTGISQLTLIEPFRNGEDRYRFYAAVVLFESGRSADAKPLMTEALPRLVRSEFVEHYAKLVLQGD